MKIIKAKTSFIVGRLSSRWIFRQLGERKDAPRETKTHFTSRREADDDGMHVVWIKRSETCGNSGGILLGSLEAENFYYYYFFYPKETSCAYKDKKINK